jgi:hypothetical protein
MVRRLVVLGGGSLLVLSASVVDVLRSREDYSDGPMLFVFVFVVIANAVVSRRSGPVAMAAAASALSAVLLGGVYWLGFVIFGDHFSRIDELAVVAGALSLILALSLGVGWVVRVAWRRLVGHGPPAA